MRRASASSHRRTGARIFFVHHSGIGGEGFKSLSEGAKVEYEAREGQKGPEALNVVAV